jgi:hypothetical protein
MSASTLLYWASGLSAGLSVCAVFSCPHGQLAAPFMLVLAGGLALIGRKQSA